MLAFVACTFQMAVAENPSGKCGENLNWVFDSETGTLTITGSGNMDNYSNRLQTPWSGIGPITYLFAGRAGKYR